MADLIVKSKVREYAKGKKMSVSSEADDALNKAVAELLDKAVARAQGNGRATIKARDI